MVIPHGTHTNQQWLRKHTAVTMPMCNNMRVRVRVLVSTEAVGRMQLIKQKICHCENYEPALLRGEKREDGASKNVPSPFAVRYTRARSFYHALIEPITATPHHREKCTRPPIHVQKIY